MVHTTNASKSAQAEDSLQKFLTGLTTLHSKLIRHPRVQSFALSVSSYLKSKQVKTKFVSEFNNKLMESKAENIKNRLNNQTRMISQGEVYLQDQQRLSHLQEQMDSPSLSSPSSDSPSVAAVTTTTPNHLLPSEASSSKSSSKPPTVKDTIFNYAVKLHEMYTQEIKLSAKQLKSISTGLSCIIDLADEEKEDTLRGLFKETVWKQLYSKYKKRSKLDPTVLPTALIDEWNYSVLLYHQSNLIRDTKNHLSNLQSKQYITDADVKIYVFTLKYPLNSNQKVFF